MSIQAEVENYLLFERDPVNIQKTKAASEEELKAVFSKRIAFGTAGLRAKMDFGIKHMNVGTIWRATQGLCQYWINSIGLEECQKRCVVVGFDGRYNSRYLAAVTAAVFMSKDIPVRCIDQVTPTPLCPFQIAKSNAFCGIQITASHNPKLDNGYKVYSMNGAQIIPPMDSDIAKCIEEAVAPWDGVDALMNHELKWLNTTSPKMVLFQDPQFTVWPQYKENISAALGVKSLSESQLKVVYTAMHGVGYKWVTDIVVNHLNFPSAQWFPVWEQAYVDPEFSTVSFPNPEEKGALDLSKEYASKYGANLVIANDPDADRFAAVERQQDGSLHQFTGDELGAIFGLIMLEKIGSAPGSFCASAVSSKFLKRVAEAEGKVFRETLTGFKWMVNTAFDVHAKDGVPPAFCYEEALGYGVCVSEIPDKCGVSASVAFLAKASQVLAEGKTMLQWLKEKMVKYGGFFATDNSYYVAPNPSVVGDLIQDFRNVVDGKATYRSEAGGYQITRIRDLALNYDSTSPSKTIESLPHINDQMLTLEFDNGAAMTVRGSGTEPKLKYYSEMVSSTSIEDAKTKLQATVAAVMKDLMGSRKLIHASEQ